MKFNSFQKFLVGGGILTLTFFVLFSVNRKSREKNQKKVLLLGGLDTRSGDKSIEAQEKLLKTGLGKKFITEFYRYNDPQGVLKAIKKDSNVYVVIFSAGCNYSLKIAKELQESGGKLKNLYIVEPYHVGGKATKAVRDSIKLGVPEKNVLVGNYKQSGLGIVPNATLTPKCLPKHWCSLTEVGKIIKSL